MSVSTFYIRWFQKLDLMEITNKKDNKNWFWFPSIIGHKIFDALIGAAAKQNKQLSKVKLKLN